MTTEVEQMLAQDQGNKNEITENLSELIAEMQKLEAEVVRMEAALKDKQIELARYSEHLVPEKMDELNLTRMILGDGSELTVTDNTRVHILVAQKEAVMNWLREKGHGDIIKNEVTTRFGSGEDEQSQEAIKLLADAGFSVEQKESVHPQTLKAFVKEQMEFGVQFPEGFSIAPGRKTKLRKPK